MPLCFKLLAADSEFDDYKLYDSIKITNQFRSQSVRRLYLILIHVVYQNVQLFDWPVYSPPR